VVEICDVVVEPDAHCGFAGVLLGYNKGLEVGEFPNPWVSGSLSLCLISYQVFMAIAHRKEEKMYVALWYTIAASSGPT
jgi:cbb3-type cytochrome oxidase subunit 1